MGVFNNTFGNTLVQLGTIQPLNKNNLKIKWKLLSYL
jgi:hypothetical protein